MNTVGVPELAILLLVLVTCLIPISAGIWALVTLHRVRSGQEAVLTRLASIEQLLRRPWKLRPIPTSIFRISLTVVGFPKNGEVNVPLYPR